jgi:Spy/CpxP family protein refolding chaperone
MFNGTRFLFAATLLLGISLAAQTTAPATPQQAAPPRTPQASGDQPSPQAQAHEAIENIGPDLSLTADQKTKLEPIIAGEIQQIRDLRADTSMTPEQKQAKFQETLAADHAKIDTILTPDQKQKLAQLHQQQAQQPSQAPPPQSQPSQPQAAPPSNPQTAQPPK